MTNRPWQRHYDFDVPTSIRYPRIPIHQLLQASAKAVPNKAALNFYGTETTYWELRLKILRLANALDELGVQKGDRVGVHLPTCPQFVIASQAASYLGAIVVNLNPMYTVDELKFMVTTTGLSTLITFESVLSNIRALCREVDIPHIVVTKTTDFMNGINQSTPEELEFEEGWHHFSLLIEGCSNTRIPPVDITPEDPAVIQFTGGTTGIPKGAVLTHANLVAATIQSAIWGGHIFKLIPVERKSVLSVLPYFHVYGMVIAMTRGMFKGDTQILVPRFEPNEFMDLLAGFEDISFFPAVPTLISAIINHPKVNDLNLDKKFILLNSGAAPMPVELIDRVKEMGIPYSEGWGMSETTSVGISNPVLGLRKTGSIGIPFPDMDVRLVDVENGDEDVPKGQPGEIIIKGPVVMKEYWDNPEETANQLKNGWLYTGDIAIQDEDDYIFIVDRKKDLIIAGGYNVYPREVDEVLYQHPKIKDAATIGIPDEYRGETIKCFIVLKEGETLTQDELTVYCEDKLAAYKRPKYIEFRKDLPKSSVGKVLRKELRAEEEAKGKKN